MVKRIELFIALCALVAVCFFVPNLEAATPGNNRTPSPKVTPCIPHVVYVQFASGAASMPGRATTQKGYQTLSAKASQFKQLMKQIGMTTIVPFDAHAPKDDITHTWGIDRMFVINYSGDMDPHELIQRLMLTGEITCGSARYIFPCLFTPNDPLRTSQYALTNMEVYKAWDITKGDTSIVIADVDCAFDIDHEDLAKSVKINWGEVGLDKNGNDKKTNGIDDDGDGQIDDWQGWDICGNTDGKSLEPDNDPRPDNSQTMTHGTATMSCFGAVGNNGKGMAGVAYGCKVLPVKAGIELYPTAIIAGYEGIQFSATHGASIINLSWGGVISSVAEQHFVDTLVLAAEARNVLIVAAAGNASQNNDLFINYPASAPGVLSVGATDQSDGPASFSDYGHSVSVWAPGSQVQLATPGNGYAKEDGTSFSSPLTAGVAGLVASAHKDWPMKFVGKQIITTCDNVVDPTTRNLFWGRVNAYAAVSTPSTTPALSIIDYSIDGVDSARLAKPGAVSAMKVKFKDYIADGSGLSVKMVPGAGYTCDQASQFLGTMSVQSIHEASFNITRSTRFSEGLLAISFLVTDGKSYSDSLVLYASLEPTPGFHFRIPTNYGQSVKQVSPNTAWAVAGVDLTNAYVQSTLARQVNGAWGKNQLLNDGNNPAYCVEALDSITAWFGTGASNHGYITQVMRTQDGGQTFDSVNVNGITKFVNTIHMFDAKNGCFVGDPPTTRWGIGITTDGGTTWKATTKPNAAKSGEASWNNATCWVGDKGWFGTNLNHIFRTTDRGQTWKSVSVNDTNCFGITFADDAMNGMCCFRAARNSSNVVAGTSAVMSSSDGGTTWNTVKLPVDTLTPGDLRVVPGTSIVFMSTNVGIYSTSDYGAHWAPVPYPAGWVSDAACVSAASDASGYTVSMLGQGSGLVSYTNQSGTVSSVTVDGEPNLTAGVTTKIHWATIGYLGEGVDIDVSVDGKTTWTSLAKAVAATAYQEAWKVPSTVSSNVWIRLTFTGGAVAYSKQLAIQEADVKSPNVSSATMSLRSAPNPSQDATTIYFDHAQRERVRIELFDEVGRSVALVQDGVSAMGMQTFALDTHSLNPGVYHCLATTESGATVSQTITVLR